MKTPDFNRAFPETPDCVRAAIEMGLRKGQAKMKMRNKIVSMCAVAAALAIAAAVAAFAAGGFSRAPRPDVLAQPAATDAPKVQEEPMVWCTEKGNYYHYDEHCSGMEGAKHRPLSEAQEMGKNTCPVCGPSEYDGQAGKESIEFIYYSENSQYFHKNQTCVGETYPLKAEALNTFFAAADAAVNKSPCPVCLPYGITMIGDGAYVNLHKTPEITPAEPDPKAELFAEATVFCTEGGSYYHSYADCSGMLNASAIRLSEAVEMGKETCPRCLGPAFVFTTPHGEYYHSEKNCSGMEGATAMNPEEALWWDKHPCPTCIIDKKVNVASCDMYYHESDACSAAEFYYDKYPLLDALTIGMTPCPECTAVEVTPEEENQDAFWAEAEADQEERVYAAYGKPLYYHKADVCNGQQNNRSLTLANAEKEQLIPCPDCYAATTSEENEEAAEPVFYCTPGGKYYHLEPDCSGMRNAEACTPEHVFINSGKFACPVCFDTDEKKALLMLPVPQDDADEVFVTPSNDYYHRSHACFHTGMISRMDLKSAKDVGYAPCPVCLSDQVDLSTFETCWTAQNGKYYHSDECCSGMQDAVYGLVEEARSKGKMRCPVCMKATPENYDLFTTAFGQEIEDLYPGYIYECTNHGFEWIISNGEESITLCEVHPKGTAFFGEKLPGVPELQLTGLSLDAQQVHDFLSDAPEPIGSMYAAAPAEVDKRSAGRSAEELQLQAVTVYFDENRRVRACEMQFGFYDHVLLKWQVNADGGIELVEGKLVLLEAEEPLGSNENEEHTASTSTTVYVAYGTSSTRYHRLKTCNGQEYPRAITEADAIQKEHLDACDTCYYDFVCFNDGMIYCHSDPNCNGITNVTLHSRKDAYVSGKVGCPYCLNVYYTDGGKYYHMLPNCSGMQNAQLHSIHDAQSRQKIRCETCLNPVSLFFISGDPYFHLDADCTGNGLRAQGGTLSEVIADYDKQPCPLCISDPMFSASKSIPS